MINNYKEIYLNSRILIIEKGCGFCRVWKHFIERENLKLKPEKRITIIDGTLMAQHGILDNPLLKVFDKFIEGFPTLFIEGKKIGLANSKEEAIAFLRSYLYDDYIIPRVKLQEVECEYVKKGFTRKRILVCGGVEEDE